MVGKKKHKGGRPLKLNKNRLEAAKKVINEDINAIILTNEEMVMAINDELKDEKDRVEYKTFEKYKKRVKDWNTDGNYEGEAELIEEFRGVLKKALFKQKQDLFKKLWWEDKARQRFAWILERKFNDWNLRNINENHNNNSWEITLKIKKIWGK